jgi:hypothetical protein
MYPWSSWRTTLPIYLGSLVLMIFLVYSYCISAHPLIPAVVIKERTAAITYFGTFLQGVIQFALLYYLPLYFEVAKQFSPTMAGVAIVSSHHIKTIVEGVAVLMEVVIDSNLRRFWHSYCSHWVSHCQDSPNQTIQYCRVVIPASWTCSNEPSRQQHLNSWLAFD